MSFSKLLASGLLAAHAAGVILAQQTNIQYPRDLPKDINVITKDGKTISLLDKVGSGKSLVFFVPNNCPMMPGRRLEDLANVEGAIRKEKLENTRIIILMDEFTNSEGKKYWDKNPVIKNVSAYRISADDLMERLDMTNANHHLQIENGKILKKNLGTNTAIWKSNLSWLGVKTPASPDMIKDYGKPSFADVQSGCIGIWKYKGEAQQAGFRF